MQVCDKTAGDTTMAMSLPDKDTPEYESYLATRIAEEEERLQELKDKCRVTSMEEQLAKLRLQSAELEARSPGYLGRSTAVDPGA